MKKVLQKIALGLSQACQNHGRRAPKSSLEASRTVFLVASAVKSALVEVQNQCKAPRSPNRHQKWPLEAQWRPNLSQHGSNLEAQTRPNGAKSVPKSMQASVLRRRREKTLFFHQITQQVK